jgi:hypothetical protein
LKFFQHNKQDDTLLTVTTCAHKLIAYGTPRIIRGSDFDFHYRHQKPVSTKACTIVNINIKQYKYTHTCGSGVLPFVSFQKTCQDKYNFCQKNEKINPSDSLSPKSFGAMYSFRN